MRALAPIQMLDAWDGGRDLGRAARALWLIAIGEPEWPKSGLARLTLGQRDALLLELHRLTFGDTLEGSARCPACDRRLDLTLEVASACFGPMPTGPVDPQAPPTVGRVEHDGWQIAFRVPDSTDLQAIEHFPSVDTAREALLRRLLVQVHQAGEPRPLNAVPEPVLAEVAMEMESLDPQIEVVVDVVCADCGHGWGLLLEISEFLASETEAEAQRLLYQVHHLARLYGWQEREILRMSSARRKAYMELAD